MWLSRTFALHEVTVYMYVFVRHPVSTACMSDTKYFCVKIVRHYIRIRRKVLPELLAMCSY